MRYPVKRKESTSGPVCLRWSPGIRLPMTRAQVSMTTAPVAVAFAIGSVSTGNPWLATGAFASLLVFALAVGPDIRSGVKARLAARRARTRQRRADEEHERETLRAEDWTIEEDRARKHEHTLRSQWKDELFYRTRLGPAGIVVDVWKATPGMGNLKYLSIAFVFSCPVAGGQQTIGEDGFGKPVSGTNRNTLWTKRITAFSVLDRDHHLLVEAIAPEETHPELREVHWIDPNNKPPWIP